MSHLLEQTNTLLMADTRADDAAHAHADDHVDFSESPLDDFADLDAELSPSFAEQLGELPPVSAQNSISDQFGFQADTPMVANLERVPGQLDPNRENEERMMRAGAGKEISLMTKSHSAMHALKNCFELRLRSKKPACLEVLQRMLVFLMIKGER